MSQQNLNKPGESQQSTMTVVKSSWVVVLGFAVVRAWDHRSLVPIKASIILALWSLSLCPSTRTATPHSHAHTYTHVYIHTHAHTHIQVNTHKHMYMHTHVHICTPLYIHIPIPCANLYLHVHIHIHVHTHILMHAQSLVYTHIFLYTHTHTHITCAHTYIPCGFCLTEALCDMGTTVWNCIGPMNFDFSLTRWIQIKILPDFQRSTANTS